MNKKHVRPAKLPPGAYSKSLPDALKKYGKSEFSPFNSRPSDKPKDWYVSSQYDMERGCYIITVVCPRCNKLVIQYADGGAQRSVEITHCGVTNNFYAGEILT